MKKTQHSEPAKAAARADDGGDDARRKTAPTDKHKKQTT